MKNTKTLKVERLIKEFDFLLFKKTYFRLSGSIRIVFRKFLFKTLEKYETSQIELAIHSFFGDSYADSVDYPCPLFIKQFDQYLNKYRPSVNKINFKTLINKYFKTKLAGEISDEIKYTFNEWEENSIQRMKQNSYGTIYDLSLEDIERLLAKKVYRDGKQGIPDSWIEAYFNRLKIYENSVLFEEEKEIAEEQKKIKKEIRKFEDALSDYEEFLRVCELKAKKLGSKKIKFNYIRDNLYKYGVTFCDEIKKCKTTDEYLEIENKLLSKIKSLRLKVEN